MKLNKIALLAVALLPTLVYASEQVGNKRTINDFDPGSVSTEAGLENWQKFYEVASHPRCSNCHVGADNIPMWSGPSYGKTRRHGMNINADESRIGAETIECSTCHRETNSAAPHGPPGAHLAWQLAPVEADWFAKSSRHICEQLKDKERNGGRSIREVAIHLDHDEVLHWAWSPGGNRQPVPHSLQETMDALMKWAAAGTPCPAQ